MPGVWKRLVQTPLVLPTLLLVLVYLVMASQFESLLHPFVIMFTLPLAVAKAAMASGVATRPIRDFAAYHTQLSQNAGAGLSQHAHQQGF